MKKLVLASMLALTAGSALAESSGWYGSLSYDNKRYQGNINDTTAHATGFNKAVWGQTIGKKLGDGWSVEALVEGEQKLGQSDSTSGVNEYLIQGRVNKDFHTDTIFTRYVGLALGQKAKDSAAKDFFIYRYDLGVKAKLTDMFGARLGYRHRQAFNSLSGTTPTAYDTDEYTLALSAKITDVDTIGVAYKIERAADTGNTPLGTAVSKSFNTWGISYTRAF